MLVSYLVYETYWRGRRPVRSRSAGQARTRPSRYWHTISWQVACTAIISLIVPFQSVMYTPTAAVIDPQSLRALVFIIITNFLLIMFGPIAFAWRSIAIRRQVLRPFARLRGLLPVTIYERALWIVVSLTTGVCEEILFRGFAIQYLMREPFAFSFINSAVIATILFGFGHAYQGWRGVMQTMLFGGFMCVLLVVTGNLILPIFVHVLVNVRVALLPPSIPQSHSARHLATRV